MLNQNLYYYKATAIQYCNGFWNLEIDLGIDSYCLQPVHLTTLDGSELTIKENDKLLIQTNRKTYQDLTSYSAIVATTEQQKKEFKSRLYTYRANISKLSDADSGLLQINMGFGHIRKKVEFRLARINAFEVTKDEKEKGLIATNFVKQLVKGNEVIVRTIKDTKDRWRRYLAELWVLSENSGEGAIYLNCNDLLVQKGHARYEFTQTAVEDINA